MGLRLDHASLIGPQASVGEGIALSCAEADAHDPVVGPDDVELESHVRVNPAACSNELALIFPHLQPAGIGTAQMGKPHGDHMCPSSDVRLQRIARGSCPPRPGDDEQRCGDADENRTGQGRDVWIPRYHAPSFVPRDRSGNRKAPATRRVTGALESWLLG